MNAHATTPLLKKMCATCPFREGSKYEYLRAELQELALKTGRICHSTGKDNAINKCTGKPEMLCRGARDFQLQLFANIGFIEAPTDEAWNKKCAEMGIQPNRRKQKKKTA